uniref:Uncharacterized protein n=1 Tax=Peronospora matthiolae TaxID=2874970 RepID=A0AAV1U263_9STRA
MRDARLRRGHSEHRRVLAGQHGFGVGHRSAGIDFTAVELRSPAAGVVAAKVSRRLAHARAWLAAASLDTKGVPHANLP